MLYGFETDDPWTEALEVAELCHVRLADAQLRVEMMAYRRREAIAAARDLGATFADIGEAIGISRSSAHRIVGQR